MQFEALNCAKRCNIAMSWYQFVLTSRTRGLILMAAHKAVAVAVQTKAVAVWAVAVAV